MRTSIATLAITLAALLACSGTADVTDGAVVTPAPAPAPAAAPSTLAGSGTAESPHKADCNVTALAIGKSAGQTDHVQCPAGCTSGSVWGTGLYTGDSRLCAAAVHAGALPGAAAGTVIVTLAGPSANFVGTDANGVMSLSWSPESPMTFAVAPTTAAPQDPVRDGKGGKAGGGGGAGGGAGGGGGGKAKGGKNR